MKWTAGLFATSLVLAGCAGPAWYRPDVTEARVEQDSSGRIAGAASGHARSPPDKLSGPRIGGGPR